MQTDAWSSERLTHRNVTDLLRIIGKHAGGRKSPQSRIQVWPKSTLLATEVVRSGLVGHDVVSMLWSIRRTNLSGFSENSSVVTGLECFYFGRRRKDPWHNNDSGLSSLPRTMSPRTELYFIPTPHSLAVVSPKTGIRATTGVIGTISFLSGVNLNVSAS